MYLIADFAALAPRFSGSISAVSSSIIIFLIYRSNVKLSSIYHRIMFGMSLADVFASTAMALTTLPMPKSDNQYWVTIGEERWVEQTKMGNVQTCAAQGFFFSTGILIMFGYNGSLCFYYSCAIAIQMKEARIKKWVEPFLHAFPLISGFIMVGPYFYLRMYNAIAHEAWCTLRPQAQFLENKSYEKWNRIIEECTLFSSVILLFSIVISFLAIILRVLQNARQLRRIRKHPLYPLKIRSPRSNNNTTIKIDDEVAAVAAVADKLVKEAHRNTKLIIAQSLAYTGGFCLTLVFPIANHILTLYYPGRTRLSVLSTKMMMVFLPLQGFFNFLIFLWHKFVNYRRANPDKSFCEIVKHLFSSNAQEPVILSRISMVTVNRADRVVEVHVENELEDSVYESRFSLFDHLGSLEEPNIDVHMDEPSLDDLPSCKSFEPDPEKRVYYQSYKPNIRREEDSKTGMRRHGLLAERPFPTARQDPAFDGFSSLPGSSLSYASSKKTKEKDLFSITNSNTGGADDVTLEKRHEDFGIVNDLSYSGTLSHDRGASVSHDNLSGRGNIGGSSVSSGGDTRRRRGLEALPGTSSTLNQVIDEESRSTFSFESSKLSSKSPGAPGTIYKKDRDGRVSVISELSEDYTLDNVMKFRDNKIAQMFRSRAMLKSNDISTNARDEEERRSRVLSKDGKAMNSDMSSVASASAAMGDSSGVSSGGAMMGQRSLDTSANKTSSDMDQSKVKKRRFYFL